MSINQVGVLELEGVGLLVAGGVGEGYVEDPDDEPLVCVESLGGPPITPVLYNA